MGPVVAIIQARMGSTRLPGKVLRELHGQPMLGHMLDRVEQATCLDQVIVATTIRVEDDAIIDFCEGRVETFRGSSEHVLSRYHGAAQEAGAGVVVRLTGDNPLIDPEVIDRVVTRFAEVEADYVSNTLERAFLRGMDVEVFSFEALARAAKEATDPYDHEHVTPYFYRNPTKFRLHSYHLRLTVDTEEDFRVVEQVLGRAGGTRMSELVGILEEL